MKNQELNGEQIQELIYAQKNEAFINLVKDHDVEKIKCNKNPNELAAIHWAASSGNIEIVRFLLSDEINENPNLTRMNNFTPLHSASMYGHHQIVELLIEKGADVNIQTEPQKYAPIHSASFAGHLKTIKILVKHGADITLKNYRDELAIDTAKRQHQIATIKYLEDLQ